MRRIDSCCSAFRLHFLRLPISSLWISLPLLQTANMVVAPCLRGWGGNAPCHCITSSFCFPIFAFWPLLFLDFPFPCFGPLFLRFLLRCSRFSSSAIFLWALPRIGRSSP